jgi:hypothetical protein
MPLCVYSDHASSLGKYLMSTNYTSILRTTLCIYNITSPITIFYSKNLREKRKYLQHPGSTYIKMPINYRKQVINYNIDMIINELCIN